MASVCSHVEGRPRETALGGPRLPHGETAWSSWRNGENAEREVAGYDGGGPVTDGQGGAAGDSAGAAGVGEGAPGEGPGPGGDGLRCFSCGTWLAVALGLREHSPCC